jgi:hypothetical protein
MNGRKEVSKVEDFLEISSFHFNQMKDSSNNAMWVVIDGYLSIHLLVKALRVSKNHAAEFDGYLYEGLSGLIDHDGDLSSNLYFLDRTFRKFQTEQKINHLKFIQCCSAVVEKLNSFLFSNGQVK